MRRWISSLSNLGYIIVGLQFWPLILLGLASGAFHWLEHWKSRENYWGSLAHKLQKTDIIAIFLVFNILAFGTIWGALLTVPLAYLRWTSKIEAKYVIPVQFAFLLLNAVSFTFVIPFIAALVFADMSEHVYNSHPFLSDVFHGIWHLLTALGFYLYLNPHLLLLT